MGLEVAQCGKRILTQILREIISDEFRTYSAPNLVVQKQNSFLLIVGTMKMSTFGKLYAYMHIATSFAF